MAAGYTGRCRRSGLMTDAEQPQLKHTFFNLVNPAVMAMVACATGDGAKRRLAEVETARMVSRMQHG